VNPRAFDDLAAFTQIVPANEVAGRGVTDCGIDVSLAGTSQRARCFQKEEVVQLAVINYPRVPDPLIIQSEHGCSLADASGLEVPSWTWIL
jgi:hypothetical protein